MVPQGVSLVTGFASAILLTRGLGPSGFGQYELVMSVVGIALSLSDLGIGQTTIRYASMAAAKGDTQQHFAVLRWAFWLRLVLALAVSAVLFVLAPILSKQIWRIEGLTGLLRLGLLAGIFGVIAAIPSIYYQSTRRFAMNAKVLVSQSLIAFAGILLLALLDRWSVFLVVMVTVVASAVRGLVFLHIIPKPALLAPESSRNLTVFRFPSLWKWVQPLSNRAEAASREGTPQEFAFYMLLSSILVMLTLRADVWLIGVYLDDYQVGLYSAAMRLTLPLAIILGAMNTAVWPRASSAGNTSEAIRLLKKTFGISVIVAIASMIYAVAAPLFAPLLFGDQYQPMVLLGQLLSFRYCIAILICPVAIIGYNFGLVRIYWVVNIVQLAVTVLLNVALLGVLGPIASAIALILDDVIAFFIAGFLILRRIKENRTEQVSA